MLLIMHLSRSTRMQVANYFLLYTVTPIAIIWLLHEYASLWAFMIDEWMSIAFTKSIYLIKKEGRVSNSV